MHLCLTKRTSFIVFYIVMFHLSFIDVYFMYNSGISVTDVYFNKAQTMTIKYKLYKIYVLLDVSKFWDIYSVGHELTQMS